MMTPYEKLKSLAQAENYLRPSVAFKKLYLLAYQETDLLAAKKMKQAIIQFMQKITQSNLSTADSENILIHRQVLLTGLR